MPHARRTMATMAAGALLTAPLVVGAAPPAAAADREFRYAGAEVELEVGKDDGGFEVEVDIDDARPGSRWLIVLRHDGKRFHRRVHRADREGDVEVERTRPDTAGRDVFKLRIKRIGASKAVTRTIRRR